MKETEAQSGSITRSKSHDWESDTGFKGQQSGFQSGLLTMKPCHLSKHNATQHDTTQHSCHMYVGLTLCQLLLPVVRISVNSLQFTLKPFYYSDKTNIY